MVLLVRIEEKNTTNFTSLALAYGYLCHPFVACVRYQFCSRVSLPNFISCYAKGV